jgi:uncharacterized protein YjbI with pentapeptide repeats
MLWQTPMFIQGVEYTPPNTLPDLASDHVFRYCRFEKLEDSVTRQVDATFLSCVFSKCDFYWSLFNVALFSECKFENCTFAGVTFADCLFIECTFVECSFTKSNLGGPCTSENTRWYGCKQSDCTGLKN